MTDDGTTDLIVAQAHAAELERQVAIERTSRETGVPAGVLAAAATAADVDAIAAGALLWKAQAPQGVPPPPRTAAVSASMVTSADSFRAGTPPQVTSAHTLKGKSAKEIMDLYRSGSLADLGAAAPRPQRIGLSGAPTDQTAR